VTLTDTNVQDNTNTSQVFIWFFLLNIDGNNKQKMNILSPLEDPDLLYTRIWIPGFSGGNKCVIKHLKTVSLLINIIPLSDNFS